MKLSKIVLLASFAPFLSTSFSMPLTAHAQGNTTLKLSQQPYSSEQEYDEYMRLGYTAEQSGNYTDAATFFRYALYAILNDQEATIAYWTQLLAYRTVHLG